MTKNPKLQIPASHWYTFAHSRWTLQGLCYIYLMSGTLAEPHVPYSFYTGSHPYTCMAHSKTENNTDVINYFYTEEQGIVSLLS